MEARRRPVASVTFREEPRLHACRREDVEEPCFAGRNTGGLTRTGGCRPPGSVRCLRTQIHGEMLIEHDRLRRQAVEVRGLDPVVAVAAEIAEMETVKCE